VPPEAVVTLSPAHASLRRPAGMTVSKTVAIVQSNYIPWKGYFDLIAASDEFILADDLQYTRRDWRNRNRIKQPHGTAWLTIPVNAKGRYLQRIDETTISDSDWAERHWRTIHGAYARAPHFDDLRPTLEGLYAGAAAESHLSAVNERFLHALCALLDVRTPITRSTDYRPEGAKSDRLLSLCLQAGATRYLSGPAARAYLDEELFARHGVEVAWFDYAGYPEYEQLHPPFEHHVSVVDLLVHTGAAAPDFLLCARSRAAR
jgi:hypothetical protein